MVIRDRAGGIGVYDFSSFQWVASEPVRVEAGLILDANLDAGACQDAPLAYPPFTDVILAADTPLPGIVFDGWTSSPTAPESPEPTNPILGFTDDTREATPIAANYLVVCHTLTLGEGISIEPDEQLPAARCPGSSNNTFVAGAVVKVRASGSVGGRLLAGFSGGVLANSVYEDPDVVDPADLGFGERGVKPQLGFVLVDGDKTVTADYPTTPERIGLGVAAGLKISAGFVAILGLAGLSALFPPVGLFFAGVGLLAAGAALVDLIPGTGGAASAFVDLVNPESIFECVTQWSFGTQPTPADNPTKNGYRYSADLANDVRKARDKLNTLKAGENLVAAVAETEEAIDIARRGSFVAAPPPPTGFLGKAKSGYTSLSAQAKSAYAATKLGRITGSSAFKLASKFGGLGVGVASGLYTAGVQNLADTVPAQTVDDLTDEETITKCLDNKWRFAGSNLTDA